MTYDATNSRQRALLAVSIAALLVVGLPVGAIGTTAAATSSSSTSPSPSLSSSAACATTVVHDAFNEENATITELNDSGEAASVGENTKVTVEAAEFAVRIKGENPNGYCVRLVVTISDRVATPAQLGNVTSNNENHVASWASVYDFENQTAHTRVEFTLPANSTATFAPSKPRLFAVAWAEKPVREAPGIFDRIRDSIPFTGGEEDLKQNTYTINGSEATAQRIPLSNENGQTINDWFALYRVDHDDAWRPIDTNTEAAVYYRHLEGEDAIEVVFNDRNATVEFTANPSYMERAEYDFKSWKRSITDLAQFELPFGALTTEVTAGWAI